MSNKVKKTEYSYSTKKAVSYSIGGIADVASYQTFTFLVFTFYFTIVGLNVILLSIGFIIWAFWNGVNDPLVGMISDRTRTRWGRRKPYFLFSIFPLAILSLLVYYPPLAWGIQAEVINFTYFIIIIIIFELFYTMYSINLISLFPETFITEEERIRANGIRYLFFVFGLILAFTLPGLIIPDYTDPKYITNYFLLGLVLIVVILVSGIILIKYGIKEREISRDIKLTGPGAISSLIKCFKNKSYRWYLLCVLCIWFVMGMIPTILPLYGKFVLNINNSLMISVLLLVFFITTPISINFIWKPIIRRLGSRKTWLISIIFWCFAMIPFFIVNDFITALIAFIFVAIGFSGGNYNSDLMMAEILDEDELNTGTRTEATYYSLGSLMVRFATIFIFLSISFTFSLVGWTEYQGENITPKIILGLRILMALFPIIALIIGSIAVFKIPLHGKRLEDIKKKIQILREMN